MDSQMGLLLAGGVATALALLLLGARPAKAAHAPVVDERAWVRRVITFISATEGRADSLNRNLDGAGLSYGILQWNQRVGNLGILLRALHQADPEAFVRFFGPSWSALLESTARGGLEPVEGVSLWEEPWVSRFVAAGRHPPFVAAQWRLAEQGEHFQGALDVALILGVRTERAIALFFDRSVQQGPGAARQMAEQLRAVGLPRGYSEILHAYAALAASRFRRTTPPQSLQFSTKAPHILWKSVGHEWHAVAGRWDLYLDIVKRTRRVLTATELSDEPLPWA